MQTGPGSPECVPDLPPGPRCHTRSFSGATLHHMYLPLRSANSARSAVNKYFDELCTNATGCSSCTKIRQKYDTLPKRNTARHCSVREWAELYYHHVVAPPSLNHTHCHPPSPLHLLFLPILKLVRLFCFRRSSNSHEIWGQICISPIGFVRTGLGK